MESPLLPLDRRLGGPQSRSGRGGEEKNSQPMGHKTNAYNILVAQPENRRPIVRPRGREEGNIKIDHKKTRMGECGLD
jgi:hypothetical protein